MATSHLFKFSFPSILLKQRYFKRLPCLAEIDIIFTGKPTDSLVKKRFIGADLFLNFRKSLLPFLFQTLIDLTRRFANPVILFLHGKTLSLFFGFKKRYEKT